ncbi:MAG: TIGR01620 family protein [Boseongicola sp.]|nr:TIGR01620 family protein [Boseongicola sp.]
MTDKDAPLVIELNADEQVENPAEAPPVVDLPDAPTGHTMQTMATLASRRPSRLFIWFWQALGVVIVFFASVAAWNAVTAMLASNPVLGWISVGLLGVFAAICLAILVKEWAALARLKKIDGLRDDVERAAETGDLNAARAMSSRVSSLYAGREDMRWARDRLNTVSSETLDVETLLGATEDTLLKPLDDLARREVETAARQVATVTALVPLAFADIIAALTANIRMIRRIAEIYGGRSGTLGSWRLTRAVLTHLVATGAVAVGDDLIGSIGGGHVLSKISRRFGEGLVNGALTARVGIAAMDVCRPMPFRTTERPRVTRLVQRALTGLFSKEG